MANIIAVVWDFDKTLVNGYMQDPIFQEYKVDAKKFWEETNALPSMYAEQGVLVNPDTIYLNQFIRYAKECRFKGLTNAKLEEFGSKLRFYDGIPDIFDRLTKIVTENPDYKPYDIKVEHYIVSTGMRRVIMGSSVMQYVQHIWGCDLIEGTDNEGEPCISEIGYTIDNTSKTRALFEINKGVHERNGVEVNTRIPEEARRVHFCNMIYVADGPSDIPAFSVVNQRHGSTFAIYPHGDMKALIQVEQMREDGRINMFAEADYSPNTTASMWLESKVQEYANRIVAEEKAKIAQFATGLPKHLVE